jgi:hypothetical protein
VDAMLIGFLSIVIAGGVQRDMSISNVMTQLSADLQNFHFVFSFIFSYFDGKYKIVGIVMTIDAFLLYLSFSVNDSSKIHFFHLLLTLFLYYNISHL